MSDYLTNLAFRALRPAETLQPRRAGMFEPEPAGRAGAAMEDFTGVEREGEENGFVDEMRTGRALPGTELNLPREAPGQLNQRIGSKPEGMREHRDTGQRPAPHSDERAGEIPSNADAMSNSGRLNDPSEGDVSDDTWRISSSRTGQPFRENDDPIIHRMPGRMAITVEGGNVQHESLKPRESMRSRAGVHAAQAGQRESEPAVDGTRPAVEIQPGGSLGYAPTESMQERESMAMHMPARRDASTAMPRRGFDAGRDTMRDERSEPSTIRVTIGRIDVRAVMPKEPARPAPATRQSAPRLSLEEYLRTQKRRER